MKLFLSPTSPYARAARIAVRVRGLTSQVEEIALNPHSDPPELLAVNPLSKVPTLVLEDGTALCDSVAVIDYLDTLGTAPRLTDYNLGGKEAAARTLGDGLTDQLVNIAMEGRRPEGERSPTMVSRWQEKSRRCLPQLSQFPFIDNPSALCAAQISCLCALGFAEFRNLLPGWREDHPALAAWFDRVSLDTHVAATAPPTN